MSSLPILEILFAIALSFNQPGFTSFTLTPPSSDQSVTWTLQASGDWRAVDASGEDLGVWSYANKTVTMRKGSDTATEKLAEHLETRQEPPSVIIDRRPVDVGLEKGKVVLTPRDDQGTLKKPVTIQYKK